MWRWHKRLFCTFIAVMFMAGIAHAQHNRDKITNITVSTSSGVHHLSAEIADTHASRHQGLMGRVEMPLNHGMLFVFNHERPLSFWMKNTPLSLDIIYFDGQGRYINHHAGTTPFSLDSLKSSSPAQYVLEINAGHAATLGITSGTRLHLPLALNE